MQLVEGIYTYIWRGIFENNSNMFYFGAPLNILFDPGLRNYVDERLKLLKEDGIDPDSIQYIINTHSHPDHLEGAAEFMNKDIKIGMHPVEIEFFQKYRPDFSAMLGMKFPDITFNMTIEEGPLNINGVELQVYHTPGHSPGSICIYWPEKKALVAGDVIFDHSFGRTDFPGGDSKKLIESIEKLSTLDIEYLMPGHMNIIVGEYAVKKNFEQVAEYFSMLR